MKTEEQKPSNPEAFAFGYGTDNYSDIQRGMTLRDYYAAKAMQAITGNVVTSQGNGIPCDHIAKDAYLIADVMLKPRTIMKKHYTIYIICGKQIWIPKIK